MLKDGALGPLFARKLCSVIRGGGTDLVAAIWLQGRQTSMVTVVSSGALGIAPNRIRLGEYLSSAELRTNVYVDD